MNIEKELTPNPNAIKFVLGVNISEYPKNFASKDICSSSPLAEELFSIPGVALVFMYKDFITVSKKSHYKWENLEGKIENIIMNYIYSGKEILKETKPSEDVSNSEIEKEIKEILDQRIRPSVAMDGGDIIYVDFKDGVVFLEMKGACVGCPQSTSTLKNGIESMLKYYIPEVLEVREVVADVAE